MKYLIKTLFFFLLLASCNNNTPLNSIENLKKAFSERNFEEINKLIDIDDYLNESLNDERELNNEIGLLIREKKIKENKRQFQKLIETGKLNRSSRIINFNFNRRVFNILKTSILKNNNSEKIKDVCIDLHYPILNDTLQLNLKLRDKKDYWQIFDLFNSFQEINQEFQFKENIYINKVNSYILDSIINKSLKIHSFVKINPNDIYSDRYQFKISNKTSEIIKIFDYRLSTPNGKMKEDFNFLSSYKKGRIINPNDEITIEETIYSYEVSRIGKMQFDVGTQIIIGNTAVPIESSHSPKSDKTLDNMKKLYEKLF